MSNVLRKDDSLVSVSPVRQQTRACTSNYYFIVRASELISLTWLYNTNLTLYFTITIQNEKDLYCPGFYWLQQRYFVYNP